MQGLDMSVAQQKEAAQMGRCRYSYQIFVVLQEPNLVRLDVHLQAGTSSGVGNRTAIKCDFVSVVSSEIAIGTTTPGTAASERFILSPTGLRCSDAGILASDQLSDGRYAVLVGA
jgi:hypothetical protein